ncbi:MAG: SPOR domain-containing protein [Chitinophagales bacterium]
MRNGLLIIFLCIVSALSAQTSGTVTFDDKAGADALIQRHIYFNKEHGELPGYRIQIFASTSLAEAKNVKSGFLRYADERTATIIFEAPNYKVRVGNYTNRIDANGDLQELLEDYPNAFIVKDLILIAEQ